MTDTTPTPPSLEELRALDTRALITRALRAAIEQPLSEGATPRDIAATARLLAEIDGLLGKHSKAPIDNDTPAHELSRADLESLAAQAPKPAKVAKRGKAAA